MVRLSRKYGYFRCPCPQGSVWESAHVYCVRGTRRVYFKQMCRKCRVARNPYRVEDLLCSYCEESPCTCTIEDRRGRRRNRRTINETRPHQRALCLKCKSGWICGDHEDDEDDEDDEYDEYD